MEDNSTKFVKGMIPWNKGKKLPYKPHPKMKGKVPWNKGIPNPRAAELGRSQKVRELNRKRMLEDNPMKKPEIVAKVSGANSSNWRGESVGYSGLHKRIYKALGKAKECSKCKSTHKVEWANKSGEYKTDLSDWMELCTNCHHEYDQIAQKAWVTKRSNHI